MDVEIIAVCHQVRFLAKYFSFEGLSLVHLINDNKANGACPDPFRTWHLRNNLNEFLKSI